MKRYNDYMNAETNQPNILINQQVPSQRQGFKWRSIFKPKIIFLALGVFLLVEAFFAIKSLQKPLPPPPQPPLPVTSGSIEILGFGNQIKIGDKILVQARLATGGNPVVGADLILRFDPKVLSLAKDDLKVGKVFTSYPAASVDEKAGLVLISGVAEESFNGIGIMAELNFVAKASGRTKISLDYKKGETKDSNIVDSKGQDILEKVKDLELEII